MLIFSFYAYGHKNIRATHKTTLEITKEDTLTTRGDCIVAIKSECSVNDLPEEIKNAIKKENTKIMLILEVENIKETIIGYGHPNLSLTHKTDIVCRKSTFICPRTIMIRANKAANDLSRELVSRLAEGDNVKVKITIQVDIA
ncbi:MAG: DUF371 domain-containing protein [Candidatus Asgardarchaeia archaeon]